MSRPRPRPAPRPRPEEWQAALRAEVAAAVRQRAAEGFDAADARDLVLATVVGLVSQAMAAGAIDGETS